MKAFIGVNYIMAVNQLPSIPIYWDCDHFVGSVGIKNIFARIRYQEFLENFHFADNAKQNRTYKDDKMRPIINRINESFQVVFSNKPGQRID